MLHLVCFIEDFGEAKVRQDNSAIGMKENIARFQVAMDDALGMCIVECRCGLFNDGNNFVERQTSSLFKNFAQRATSHMGHDEIGKVFLFAIFVNGHDMNVVQCGNRVCLTAKA